MILMRATRLNLLGVGIWVLQLVQLNGDHFDKKTDLAAETKGSDSNIFTLNLVLPGLLELETSIVGDQNLAFEDVSDQILHEVFVHIACFLSMLERLVGILVFLATASVLVGTCIEVVALLQLGDELVHHMRQHGTHRIDVALLGLQDPVEQLSDDGVVRQEVYLLERLLGTNFFLYHVTEE